MNIDNRFKSDVEQLAGILALFDEEVIKRATDSYLSSGVKPAYLGIEDCADPGEEITQHSDSLVTLDELGANERIVQPEVNFLPAHFLEEDAKVLNAVARVHTGRSLGTGFLISDSLFMTNNHVIPDQATANRTRIQFNYQLDYDGSLDQIDEYRVDPDVFFTDSALDFTIMRLRSKRQPLFFGSGRESEAYEDADESIVGLSSTTNSFSAANNLAFRPPLLRFIRAGQKWGHIPLNAHPRHARDQQFNVIQHPRGRRKGVSIQDNKFYRLFTNMVHYTSDTEPGSSGSPVFNNSWDLVALHHAGGRRDGSRWLSNEGVRIDKIVARLREHYNATANGRRILRELGIG